jgi:hypothetical protein
MIFCKHFGIVLILSILQNAHSKVTNPCNGTKTLIIDDGNPNLYIIPSDLSMFESNMSCFWNISFETKHPDTIVHLFNSFLVNSINYYETDPNKPYEIRVWNCKGNEPDWFFLNNDFSAPTGEIFTEESNICVLFQTFNISDNITRFWNLTLTLINNINRTVVRIIIYRQMGNQEVAEEFSDSIWLAYR